MKIKIKRKLWAKSTTWNVIGKPNCIGGHVMNALGFPMKQFKSPDFGPTILNGIKVKNPGFFGPYEEFFYIAQEQICKEYNMDVDFQNLSEKLNDKKDEKGLKKLFASKGITLVFTK